MNKLVFLLSILLLPAVISYAQPVEKPIFLNHIARHTRMQPSVKPPLLIMIHGYGSNERDLMNIANKAPESIKVVSLQGPYMIGENKYSWYGLTWKDGKVINRDGGQMEISRKLIINEIKKVIEIYNADHKRVYLLGFSQGAILSLSIGLTAPELVDGIIPISGQLDSGLIEKISTSPALKDLDIFLAHGSKDEIIGVKEAHKTKAFLAEYTTNIQYEEFEGGHTIPVAVFERAMKWLLELSDQTK